MLDEFSRSEMMLGRDNMLRLKNAKVCVFGVGGVGGYAAEGIARAGVGTIHLVDNDSVSITNLNRQIIALHSTIGQDKVSAMASRIADISPETKVFCHNMFYLPDNEEGIQLFENQFDYVVDAVDTVAAKLSIIEKCSEKNIPVISAMGAGNKLDPTKLCCCDIYSTSVDPLARVMRHECRKRGIKKLTVVYSTEESRVYGDSSVNEDIPEGSSRHNIPGSCVFVPSAMGMIISSRVVRDIIKL